MRQAVLRGLERLKGLGDWRVRVRVRPRAPGEPALRGAAGVDVVTARGPGLLDARPDDQVAWLGGWRRLLDALEAPIQLVIDTEPGSQLPRERTGRGPRARDLAFAAELAAQSDAVHRSVRLVVAAGAGTGLASRLRDAGVHRAGVEAAECPPLFGDETVTAFKDAPGRWHRTYSIERYPGGGLEPGWLRALAPPGVATSIGCHIRPLPTDWVVGFLQRRLAGMRAARLDGSSDPRLTGAVPAAEDLQARLVASQERAFEVAVHVTVSAATESELTAGCRRLEESARASLLRLAPCWFDQAPGRAATLPRLASPRAGGRVLDTSSLSTFYPWLDADLRQAQGLVVGRSAATGLPVLIDPFDEARYANANIGVFGHSGAGKTYLMSTLALGSVAAGAQVFVLDPEHEYERLAAAAGGVSVRLALGSGVAINALDIGAARASDEAAIGPRVADTVDLVAILSGGLDEAELAAVELAVRAAFRECEQPLLGDVAARLAPGTRAAAVLGRWVQGSLGAMFNRPTSIDLEAPVVVFGMRELRDELVPPVHFLLANLLWRLVKETSRRRLLVVDELGLLFEDATLRRFVVNLARRIRKYNGGLIFATQNPGDLLATEAGAVVATNPAIHFFGATRPGEAARLQAAFDLSDPLRARIETARRGEFVLAAAAERLAVAVAAPPWQVTAMGKGGRAPVRKIVGRGDSGSTRGRRQASARAPDPDGERRVA